MEIPWCESSDACHIGAVLERFATLITLIGLFTSMNPLVSKEIYVLNKCLHVLFILIGVLLRMDFLMHNEVGVVEIIPTLYRFKHTLSSVSSLYWVTYEPFKKAFPHLLYSQGFSLVWIVRCTVR